MYGKLIDGNIVFAPIPLKINNKDVFTNDKDRYLSCGDKAIVNTEMPVQEGYIADPAWAETEKEITQTWTLEIAPEPPQTQEERISALEAENAELRAAVEALISGSTGGSTT